MMIRTISEENQVKCPCVEENSSWITFKKRTVCKAKKKNSIVQQAPSFLSFEILQFSEYCSYLVLPVFGVEKGESQS
jgi:hypothetical protein